MKKAILLLTLSAAAAMAQDRPQPGYWYKSSVTTLQAAIVADAVSTELALRRPGVYESNPLMQSRAVRIGGHAALAVGLPYMESRMMKRHQKIATILNFGLAAGFTTIARSNFQLARW